MRRGSLAKRRALLGVAVLVAVRAALLAYELRELRSLSERPPSVDRFAS
jgi:hypothetical protein